jgi:DNA-directed RNA polymerase II subunit RPB2/DNA-directed RNA polymerase-4/5 subunit 2
MEELQKDSGQLSNGSDSEPEAMVLDDNGAGKSHSMDENRGSPIDVDEDQSYMDVDIKGKSSLNDDVNGKSSSEPYSNAPIDRSFFFFLKAIGGRVSPPTVKY